jgi:hypothetical protein
VEVITTFDPKKTTVDVHAEDCPALQAKKKLGEVELKFIKQVFYGCFRYQKFLKLFVTSFLYRSAAQAERSEQTIYTVLAYLLFFRLEELGVAEFRQLVTCGAVSMPALHAMLHYALSQEDLERWVKAEWCKIYDISYVEQEIIGKLMRFAEELRPVLEEVEFKATGTIRDDDGFILVPEKKRTCSPKPFNLTKVRPRLIPEPEVILREVKPLPLPPSTHETRLEAIAEEKLKRREEEKARVAIKYQYAKAPIDPASARDETALEEVARNLEAERMAECTFKPNIRKYAPPTEEAVVRTNTAAVLREDALLRQKQAKEYDMLKRYEQELHDPSEYYRWQEEVRAKDDEANEQQVLQRMAEMQMARVGAIEAAKEEKRKRAEAADQQKEELRVQREAADLEEERRAGDRVGRVVQHIVHRVPAVAHRSQDRRGNPHRARLLQPD